MGVPKRSAIPLTLATLALASLVGVPLVEAASRAAPRASAPRGSAPRASAPRASAPRMSAPRTSASGTRATAAPRGTATRGTTSPRGTANGTARYGYGGYGGYGYGGGYYPYYPYYPYYGYGWPYWGWYGDWWYGYPYFGVGVTIGGTYGPTYPEGYEAAPTGPAIVETDISPSKAEVILDGASAGLAKDFNGTWDELRITPGHHTITFRKEGYRSLTVDFDAAAGGRYVFNQELVKGEGEDKIERPREEVAPAPPPAPAGVAKGFLRIRVLPDDAAIYLDGGYLGTGFELSSLHGALSVAQGEHVIEIVRPGFKTETRTVLVGSDGHALFDLQLEKAGP